MDQIPRLDIMIYAHDGRGLGHASRSIGIGMAVRRLFPALRVLFVSGCRFSQDLIGGAPLDWLKLPSYETRVEGGISRGIAGRSMYSDAELGTLRARELLHIVDLYRPRLVLVDHTPQGKHKELVPALSASKAFGTIWVLGVRGVIGAVPQASSDIAVKLFSQHYQELLWYGDTRVLGANHCQALHHQYGSIPVECGYVLRLAEFVFWNSQLSTPLTCLAGTVAIPWLGEGSLGFLVRLAAALKKIPAAFGVWHLFIDTGTEPDAKKVIGEIFRGVDNCRLESPSGNYVPTLLTSRTALVYGGYNSIMDVLHTRIPALFIYREMGDEEQQLHLERIVEAVGENVTMISESQVSVEDLEMLLLANLGKKMADTYDIRMDGASCAAQHLCRLLT